MTSGLIISLWLAVAPIEVRAQGDCPRGDEVEQHLLRLSPGPARAPGQQPRVAELAAEGPAVRLRLRESDGRVVQEKTLTGYACAERAEAVAVVLATWDTQLASGLSLDRVVEVQASAPPAQSLLVEPFAAAYLGVDRASLLPGLRAGARVRPPGSRLGGAVSVSAFGPEAQALAGGQARWGRVALGAGPLLRAGRRPWTFAAEASALAGVLLARGADFAQARTSGGFDAGALVGASIERQLGGVTPFLGLSLLGWLRPHRAQVAGTTAALDLPRVQLLAGAGVTFGDTP